MKNCIVVQKCRFDQQRISGAILERIKRRKHGLNMSSVQNPGLPTIFETMLHKDACEMNVASPNSQLCRSNLDALALPCRPSRFEYGFGDACVIIQGLHNSGALDHAVPCSEREGSVFLLDLFSIQ